MSKERRPFSLPMTTIISLHKDVKAAKVIAHSLDFDLVCSGQNEGEAISKLRLAVKSYIEFGLSNGWNDDILFPAPAENWDVILSPDAVFSPEGEPIYIFDRKMTVLKRRDEHREAALTA